MHAITQPIVIACNTRGTKVPIGADALAHWVTPKDVNGAKTRVRHVGLSLPT